MVLEVLSCMHEAHTDFFFLSFHEAAFMRNYCNL